jgi:hypothetical protein
MSISSDTVRGTRGFLNRLDSMLIALDPVLEGVEDIGPEFLEIEQPEEGELSKPKKVAKPRPDVLKPGERYITFKGMKYILGPMINGVAKVYGKNGLAGMVVDPSAYKGTLEDIPEGFSPEVFGKYLATMTATTKSEREQEEKRAQDLINTIISDPISADAAVEELKKLGPMANDVIKKALGELIQKKMGAQQTYAPEPPAEEFKPSKPSIPLKTPEDKKKVDDMLAKLIKRKKLGESVVKEAVDPADIAIQKLKDAQSAFRGVNGIFKIYDKVLIHTDLYDEFSALRDNYNRNVAKINNAYQIGEKTSSNRKVEIAKQNEIALQSLLELLGASLERYSEGELMPALKGRKDVTSQLDFEYDLLLPVASELERLAAADIARNRKELLQQQGKIGEVEGPEAITMADRGKAREKQVMDYIRSLVDRGAISREALSADPIKREAILSDLDEKFKNESTTLYSQIMAYLDGKGAEPKNWETIKPALIKNLAELKILDPATIRPGEEDKSIKDGISRLSTRMGVINLGIAESPFIDPKNAPPEIVRQEVKLREQNLSSLNDYLTGKDEWYKHELRGKKPLEGFEKMNLYKKLIDVLLTNSNNKEWSESVLNYFAKLFDGKNIPTLFKNNNILASRFSGKMLRLKDGKIDDHSKGLIDEFVSNFDKLPPTTQDQLIRATFNKVHQIWNSDKDNATYLNHAFDEFFQKQGLPGSISDKIGIKTGDTDIELTKQAGKLPSEMQGMTPEEQKDFIRLVLADPTHPYHDTLRKSFGHNIQQTSFSTEAKPLIYGEGWELPESGGSTLPKAVLDELVKNGVDEKQAAAMTKHEAIEALRTLGYSEENIRNLLPGKSVPEGDDYVGKYVERYLANKHQDKRRTSPENPKGEKLTPEEIFTMDDPWAYVGYRVTYEMPTGGSWVSGAKRGQEGDAGPGDLYIPFWVTDNDNGRRDADRLLEQKLDPEANPGYPAKYSAVKEIPYDAKITKGPPGSTLYKPLSKKKASEVESEVDFDILGIEGDEISGKKKPKSVTSTADFSIADQPLGAFGDEEGLEKEQERVPAQIKRPQDIPKTAANVPAAVIPTKRPVATTPKSVSNLDLGVMKAKQPQAKPVAKPAPAAPVKKAPEIDVEMGEDEPIAND